MPNDVIRYDYSLPYTPKAESIKFFSWCNMMWGEEVNTTPKVHFQLMDNMFSRSKKVVSLCHRGFAKTTLVSHKTPLYVAVFGFPNFGKVSNAVLLSDTFEQADNQILSMVSYFEKSPKLQSMLTLKQRKQGMALFENNKGEEFHISARGAGQSFRGTNYKGQRPQWIIGDDLLSDDILFNKDLSEKTIKWWSSVVTEAMDENSYKMTVIGTPLTQDDLLARLSANTQWRALKFPVANEFPVPKEDIISSWPDRFTPEKIYERYSESLEMGTDNEFFRERMLEVVTDDTRVFKTEWFKEYKWEDIRKEKSKYNFFTTMDLAVSKKEHADFTVILTIAVSAQGRWYIVRIDHGRFNPSETIDKLFAHVRAFRPLEVKAEKAALQQVLGHFIEEKMIKENTHFLYNPLENNSKMSKEYRILALQPKMKRREIYFPSDVYHDSVAELRHELLGYTKEGATTKHDDLSDSLANFLDEGFVVTPSDYSEESASGNSIQYRDPSMI